MSKKQEKENKINEEINKEGGRRKTERGKRR